MIDLAAIGHVTQELMEQIEGEFGEGAELSAAMIVVEVTVPGEDGDDEDGNFEARWRTTPESAAIAVGLAAQINSTA